MTKAIILGKGGEPQDPKPLEKIRLLYWLGDWLKMNPILSVSSSDFDFVELVARDYCKGPNLDKKLDLIFVYDEDDGREKGMLCAGYWNDGVV